MKKRIVQILFILTFIAVVIGLMSGSIRRQTLPLFTILLILITGMDFYISGKSLERVIAWIAVWLEAGWEILFLIKDSVEWLSLAAATLEKLSFLVLMFFFFGISLLIWLLFGKPVLMRENALSQSEDKLIAFFQRWKTEILICILTALSLRFLMHSGYYWDDAVNSTAYLFEKQDQLPLIQNLINFMRKYLELGRINLISCYYYFLFYIENVKLYKLIIILSVCINQVVFGMLVRYAGGSKRLGQAAMLTIPLLIQFRGYQDPVTGFYSLMQVILLELMLTAYFLLRYLRESSVKFLWLGLIPFFCGLMTYEVCFPFILMIPVIAWLETHDRKKTIRVCFPYGILFAGILAMALFVRNQFIQGTPYSGIAFQFDVLKILKTYGLQLLAGLPFSFYIFTQSIPIMGSEYLASEVFYDQASDILCHTEIADWLLGLGIVYLFSLILKEGKGNQRDVSTRLLMGIGLSFWLLPGITIAMSARYQGQIIPGLGYLPVYLEYFGVGIVAICLALEGYRRIRPISLRPVLSLLIASGLAIGFVFNSQNNRSVIELLNRSFLYPRLAGERALRNGLADFLPAEAQLVSLNSDNYLWEANWDRKGLYSEFYTITSGRNFTNGSLSVIGMDQETFMQQYAEKAIPDNLYVVQYAGDSEQGLAKLGRVRSVEYENLETDLVLYFISGNFPQNSAVTFQRSDEKNLILGHEQAWQVRATDAGNLYQLPEQEVINFDSLDFYGF